jgi:hypothetical protein
MPDGTIIEIIDSGIHPESGHISIRVRSVTTKGTASWSGPVRTYGCDAAMFKHRFNGDIEQMKAWIKSEHIGYDGAHADLVDAVTKMKGTTL